MALLVDILGFFDVLLRGLGLVAQSLTVGGIVFLLCLERALARQRDAGGAATVVTARRLLRVAALLLAVIAGLKILATIAILTGTTDIGLAKALTANVVIANAGALIAAAATAALAGPHRGRSPATLLLFGLAILAASIATSHAVARLDDRVPLAVLSFLHQAGAAVWIGGIPYFLVALARLQRLPDAAYVAARFSAMSMAGVAALLVGALGLAVVYVGSLNGLYGTSYGAMVATKAVMLGGILCLGGANFFAVRRMAADDSAPVMRLRRFAEVEAGIGVAVFLAAASLTSVPPAVDFAGDQVAWRDIVARMTPHWPSFASPPQQVLSIPALQAKLDAASAPGNAPRRAYVPGAGIPPPQTPEDIAWSEFNHHWSGVFVLVAGLLALMDRAGARWARHWPLVFIGLSGFLIVRSDPEAWPLGDIGFFESMREPEVLQHRIFMSLVAVLGIFEWMVRTGRIRARRAALAFPALCIAGGTLLLSHSHALADFKEELLIELTHLPLAVLALAAGWARWLELRLPAGKHPILGWVWPAAITGIGVLLLLYRES